MIYRYGVKRNEITWFVVDKSDGSVLAHFNSRNQARIHARQMNEIVRREQESVAA